MKTFSKILLAVFLLCSTAQAAGPTVAAGAVKLIPNTSPPCTAGDSCIWLSGSTLKQRLSGGSDVTIATGSALPSQTGNSGKFLTTDGSAAAWSSQVVGGVGLVLRANSAAADATLIIESKPGSELVRLGRAVDPSFGPDGFLFEASTVSDPSQGFQIGVSGQPSNLLSGVPLIVYAGDGAAAGAGQPGSLGGTIYEYAGNGGPGTSLLAAGAGGDARYIPGDAGAANGGPGANGGNTKILYGIGSGSGHNGTVEVGTQFGPTEVYAVNIASINSSTNILGPLVLSSTINGISPANLMTLSGAQAVTGAKTFNASTLLVNNAGNTFAHTIASSTTTAKTWTLPDLTATAAQITSAQTFAGTQSFTGTINANGGISRGSAGTLNIGTAANTTALNLGSTATSVTTSVLGQTVAITGTTAVALSATSSITADAGAIANSYNFKISGTSFFDVDGTAGGNVTVRTTASGAIRFIDKASHVWLNTDTASAPNVTMNASGTLIAGSGTSVANAVRFQVAGSDFINANGSGATEITLRALTGGAIRVIDGSQHVFLNADTAGSPNVTLSAAGALNINAATIGAFGATAVARQTVSGSRGGSAALASLLSGLAAEGWITDSTSAGSSSVTSVSGTAPITSTGGATPAIGLNQGAAFHFTGGGTAVAIDNDASIGGNLSVPQLNGSMIVTGSSIDVPGILFTIGATSSIVAIRDGGNDANINLGPGVKCYGDFIVDAGGNTALNVSTSTGYSEFRSATSLALSSGSGGASIGLDGSSQLIQMTATNGINLDGVSGAVLVNGSGFNVNVGGGSTYHASSIDIGNGGSTGFFFDGSEINGTAANAINLIATSGNASLHLNGDGELITMSSSGIITLSSQADGLWEVGNGNLTFSTASAGNNIFITSAGNVEITSDSGLVTNKSLLITTAGEGIKIKEGSNARMGVATLVAGTVTVSNTSVTADSRIFVLAQNNSGTISALSISARTAGTSFTIKSLNILDTSTVAWFMMEPF